MFYNYQQIKFADSYLFQLRASKKAELSYDLTNRRQPEGRSLPPKQLLDSVNDLMAVVAQNLEIQPRRQEFHRQLDKTLQPVMSIIAPRPYPEPNQGPGSELHQMSISVSQTPVYNTVFDVSAANLKSEDHQSPVSDFKQVPEHNYGQLKSKIATDRNLEEKKPNKPNLYWDSPTGLNSESGSQSQKVLHKILEVEPPKATASQCLAIPQHLHVKEIPQQGKQPRPIAVFIP